MQARITLLSVMFYFDTYRFANIIRVTCCIVLMHLSDRHERDEGFQGDLQGHISYMVQGDQRDVHMAWTGCMSPVINTLP